MEIAEFISPFLTVLDENGHNLKISSFHIALLEFIINTENIIKKSMDCSEDWCSFIIQNGLHVIWSRGIELKNHYDGVLEKKL